MKNKITYLIFAFLLSTFISSSQIRVKQNFNKAWKFSLADSSEFSLPDFDDTEWRPLDLPHDWSIEGEFSEQNSGRNAWLPGGVAWYRKSFELAKTDSGKYFEIQFDGVYRHSKVWVNGVFVGTQYDGYTSFYFDITEALNFGEENVIAVRVDNSVQPNCRWYSGSGIYRNVWLTVTNPLHVKNWGTYITTPNISDQNATVLIRTTVENLGLTDASYVLETKILDKKGTEIATVASNEKIDRLRDVEIQQEIKIANPKLWELNDPVLYTAVSKLKVDGKVVDEYSSPFGIRTIDFDAQNGFFLNGHNMKIKGVCLHHDAGAFGAAVPLQVWERRLAKLKAIGCNAIRTAHNPHAPEFLDLCDIMGFLVMDEFVDKWNNSDAEFEFYAAPFADPYFHTEWQKNFGETIRRDRNHPSIIIWSVGNENHHPGSKRQNLGLKRYCNFVRSTDPSRPVISGMERWKDLPTVEEKVDNIVESTQFMDFVAMNYGEQWCKLIYDKNTEKPYLSTESYTYFNSSEQKRWAMLESNPWLDVLRNDFNMGLFLWVGINYLGESKTWPYLGSSSGLFDMAGFRTERADLFEAFWSEKPVVHINVYETNADDFSEVGGWGWPPMKKRWNLENGQKYDLVTYTNCEEVDLFLNDTKIGTQKLADVPNWIMKWRDVTFKPGELKAVGKINGKIVCEEILTTADKPAEFDVKVIRPALTSNNIIQVEIRLVDKQGNLVEFDDREIRCSVEGPGELLLLCNGRNTAGENLQQKESQTSYKGKLLAVIKASENVEKKTEKLKLIISGEGLKNQIVDLPVK